MKIIKWINKFSGESGYVKSVLKSKGYFVNTWERDNAKTYLNDGMAKKDLLLIEEMGEAVNNDFVIEDK